MKKARAFFAFAGSVALAAACGGSSASPDGGDDGSVADAVGSSSGSRGGSSGGSGSSGSGSSGVGDAGRMTCVIGACPASQVCCEQGCQAQSTCGMAGNRQLCASNADCPATYPSCRGGGMGAAMTCRACQSATDCSSGQVCCQRGCEAQTACGMTGNRQLCTSSNECPTNYPDCRGNPPYCRTPIAEGGAAEGGAQEGGGSDSGMGDGAMTDGNASDASTDGSVSDASGSD